MQSITVHPPGEVFQKPLSLTGEIEILGLEPGALPDRSPAAAATRSALPPATSYSRKLYQKGMQTFSWKADDPNGDTLSYEVQYRPRGREPVPPPAPRPDASRSWPGTRRRCRTDAT